MPALSEPLYEADAAGDGWVHGKTLGPCWQVGESTTWTDAGGYVPKWFMESAGDGLWRILDVTHGEVLASGPYRPGVRVYEVPIAVAAPARVMVQVLGATVQIAGLVH